MIAVPIADTARIRRAERVRPRHRAARPARDRGPTLDDDHEALLVNGGGFDGGHGTFLVNAGDDVHAVGLLAPLIEGHIGCVVIRPDGSRYLARVMPRPRWRIEADYPALETASQRLESAS